MDRPNKLQTRFEFTPRISILVQKIELSEMGAKKFPKLTYPHQMQISLPCVKFQTSSAIQKSHRVAIEIVFI
jgi:hypothetical protein